MQLSKWLVGLLITSLVLNLLLVGFGVGRMSDRTGGFAGPDPMLGFPQLLRSLPEARRRELGPIVREHLKALRPSIRSMRSTQQALHTALNTDPFVRSDLENALTLFRTHLDESQLASHKSFVDFVVALTPQERTQLSRSMKHIVRHRTEHPAGRRGMRRPGVEQDLSMPPVPQ